MTKTYGPYFQDIYQTLEETPSYMRLHYDTTGFYNPSQTKDLKKRKDSVIAAIRNNFVLGINEQVLLPKAIIIVLEEDLIKSTNHFKKGASIVIEAAINWLAEELHRIAITHKASLPSKSCKFKYPQFLWVAATYHDNYGNGNFYRQKFNDILSEITSKYREMQMLHLYAWDEKNTSKFNERGKLNSEGFTKYWSALNDAFQAWDKDQFKSLHKPQGFQLSTTKRKNNDRFHWTAKQRDPKKGKFLLPKPPSATDRRR